MAMGKQVGRLSIRILPDATRFRADLSKTIERIEKTMFVHLEVKADTKQAELDLARFRTAESGKSIGVHANASTQVAKGQLALLARDRFVALRVKLDKASIAKAATALEALSGFRVARSVFGDVTDALKDIDLNVPKIARVALGIGSLASVVLTSSAGLVTLAGDLTKMGNAGLLLPAMLSGMAVGIGTLVAALKDGKDQLAVLAPMFHELQDTISANFWAQAKMPIIDFMESVLPQLRTGFGLTATALGNQAAAIADAFRGTFANGVLEGMFVRLGQTMDIVTTGAQGFAEAVTTLGVTGSNYLPRMAEWVVKIGDSFNSWVQVSAASGALDMYIEDGITQIKLFGSSVGSMVSILRGIDSAATAAGATGLTSFSENMAGAAAIINSPAVQTALTTILTGANAAMAGLGGGMEKVGDMLVAIAPQISTVLGLAGEAVGGLVGAIADAMAAPGFSTGLVNFFEGLKSGVDALGPAMLPLLNFIGQLGTTVGTLAAQIGPLLAVIKETFAPLLDSLLVAITPLIPLIGGALNGAIASLAPLVQGLSTIISENSGAIGGLVLAVGVLALGIKITSAAMAAYQIVMGIVKGVQLGFAAASYGAAAASYAQGAAAKAGVVIGWAVAAAQAVVTGALYSQVAAWVASTAAQVASKAVMLGGAVATGVATAAMWLFNIALNANPIALVVIAIAALVAGLIWFFTQTEVGKQAWSNFVQFLGEAWANITAFFTEAGANISALWGALWAGIGTVITVVWDAIVLGVTTYIRVVLAVLTAVGMAISGIWNAVWGGIAAVFGVIWNTIVSLITGYINVVRTIIDTVLKVIVAIFTGNWDAIGGIISDAWSKISGIVGGMVNGIRNAIGQIGNILGGVRDAVFGAINGAGSWLADAGRSIIQGLINGITGMIGKVRKAASDVMQAISNFFPHSPAKEGPFSGRGWTLYSGEAMGDGLVDGMDSRLASVRAAALAMTKAARVDASAVLGDFDVQSSSAGSAGAGNQVNLTVNNPIAEPTSETIRRGAQLVGAALV